MYMTVCLESLQQQILLKTFSNKNTNISKLVRVWII